LGCASERHRLCGTAEPVDLSASSIVADIARSGCWRLRMGGGGGGGGGGGWGLGGGGVGFVVVFGMF